MKIADLDSETRKVIYIAHIVSDRWKRNNLTDMPVVLDKLLDACKAFDIHHEAERSENLVRALWGPGGLLEGSDDDKQSH
jgi:hypothetical protein